MRKEQWWSWRDCNAHANYAISEAEHCEQSSVRLWTIIMLSVYIPAIEKHWWVGVNETSQKDVSLRRYLVWRQNRGEYDRQARHHLRHWLCPINMAMVSIVLTQQLYVSQEGKTQLTDIYPAETFHSVALLEYHCSRISFKALSVDPNRSFKTINMQAQLQLTVAILQTLQILLSSSRFQWIADLQQSHPTTQVHQCFASVMLIRCYQRRGPPFHKRMLWGHPKHPLPLLKSRESQKLCRNLYESLCCLPPEPAGCCPSDSLYFGPLPGPASPPSLIVHPPMQWHFRQKKWQHSQSHVSQKCPGFVEQLFEPHAT